MSNLVTIIFNDETTAFDMRVAFGKMQKEYLIEMEDAVVVTKDAEGKAKLHQAVSPSVIGASSGAFWGMLIGMLFLNPLLGIAVGTGAGAISGKLSDIGIDDEMMKEVAATFTPGSSALCILVRHANVEKVLEELRVFAGRGKVLRTSLKKDTEEALRAVLEKV